MTRKQTLLHLLLRQVYCQDTFNKLLFQISLEQNERKKKNKNYARLIFGIIIIT